MTTLLPMKGAAAWRDPKAAMERECRHVTGASVTLRRGALLEAAINLGRNPDVTLEGAFSALLAAAQAGGYPDDIDGGAIAGFIRYWLVSGRKLVPGWDSSRYRDWISPQPKPPQDAVAPAPEPLPVIAAEVVPLAPDAAQSAISDRSNSTCAPPHPAPSAPTPDQVRGRLSPQRGEVTLGHGIATGSPLPVGERSRAKRAGEGEPEPPRHLPLGSFCLMRPMSFQGSWRNRARRWRTLPTLNLSAVSRAVTSLQSTGVDTGAPARARVE
jgi:hypothetical protein